MNVELTNDSWPRGGETRYHRVIVQSAGVGSVFGFCWEHSEDVRAPAVETQIQRSISRRVDLDVLGPNFRKPSRVV